jgi:hypothetical protein
MKYKICFRVPSILNTNPYVETHQQGSASKIYYVSLHSIQLHCILLRFIHLYSIKVLNKECLVYEFSYL